MTNIDKQKSFNAFEKFLSNSGRTPIPYYIPAFSCSINVHENKPYYFYDDTIEISYNSLHAYFVIHYPYLNSFNVTTNINSNKFLFVWDKIDKVLSVNVDG